MAWVKFMVDYKVQQWDGNGPHYRAGQSYDLERSYAEKYVRLGKATPCDPPAPIEAPRQAPGIVDERPADPPIDPMPEPEAAAEEPRRDQHHDHRRRPR